MTAYVPAPSYLRTRRKAQPSRVWTLGAIAALHIGALGALFYTRHAEAPDVPPQTMMVTFISETPQPEAVPPPPPPPEPEPPKPKPKMVATPKPTPSPVQAPPIEAPPVDSKPLEETPPQPPTPPAPAAPAPVIPPNFVAAYLNNPGPKYPSASIRMHEQGIVMLLVLVSAEGRAEQVTVEKSSGFSRLDDAAVDVIKNRWRFVPAKQGDKAVAAWVRIPMSFALNQH